MKLLPRLAAMAVSATLVLLGIVAPGFATAAHALSGSDFRAGSIISDQVFFDTGTMSQTAIQSFLAGKEQGCTAAYGYPCLKDYTQSTYTRAASAGRCNGYVGAANEPASQIIFKVAMSCGINPQVLITLLEKEQGLVSSKAPTSWKYQAATGYGCPDTAPCNAEYYGFYNQVYRAAWQFKEYVVNPGYWRYHVGNVAVQYSPNAACGSSIVNIQNAATAALYNYTPYQPNAAALNNLYGLGDSCSAYGNRNFWVYFNSWFGAPSGPVDPMASFDGASVQYSESGTSLRVSGWAIDPARPTSTALVDVYVDQPDGTTKGYEFKADSNRPDVGAVYTNAGPNHGFSQDIPLPKPGSYRACVFPMTGGGGWLLQCRTVIVPDSAAIGSVDSLAPSITDQKAVNVTARGWAIDESSPSVPTTVSLVLTSPSGVASHVESPATQSRPDVASVYTQAGGDHGYSLTLPVAETTPGTYRACVSATGHGVVGKVSVPLGCSNISLGRSDTTGVLDFAELEPNSDGTAVIAFGGWSLDQAWPTTSIPVDVYLNRPDGSVSGSELIANGSRPDIARLNPAAGSAHGFKGAFSITKAGEYKACAFAIGQSPFGASNSLLGCVAVMVKETAPSGSLDSFGLTMTGGTPELSASGWGMDLGLTSASSPVDLYLDRPDGTSQGIRVTANGSRPDIARVFSGAGEAHGFKVGFPVSAKGTYRLCAFAIAISRFSQPNSLVGCKSTTVGGATPTGSLDSVVASGAAGSRIITSSGWAADPGVPGVSIPVSLYLDLPDGTTRGMQVTADGQRPDVGRAFPGFGSAHGFVGTFSGLTEVGKYRLCAFGIAGSPFSGNSLLGCQIVNVG